jgi:hypothetical protein
MHNRYTGYEAEIDGDTMKGTWERKPLEVRGRTVQIRGKTCLKLAPQARPGGFSAFRQGPAKSGTATIASSSPPAGPPVHSGGPASISDRILPDSPPMPDFTIGFRCARPPLGQTAERGEVPAPSTRPWACDAREAP